MAKVKIFGDAIIVTSSLKTKEIQLIEKFDRRALTLYNREIDGSIGAPEFAIATTKGAGAFINNGIIFDKTNEQGYAMLTFLEAAGKNKTEKLDNFKEKFAMAMVRLNTLEDRVAGTATLLNGAFAEAMSNVEYVGAEVATAPDEVPVTEAAEEVEAVEE